MNIGASVTKGGHIEREYAIFGVSRPINESCYWYWNKAAAVRERFMDDPYFHEPPESGPKNPAPEVSGGFAAPFQVSIDVWGKPSQMRKER
jgi:hypothetical protein